MKEITVVIDFDDVEYAADCNDVHLTDQQKEKILSTFNHKISDLLKETAREWLVAVVKEFFTEETTA